MNKEKSLLRPLQKSDAAISLHWRNDPKIRDMVLGYRFPVTEIMEGEWLEKAMNDQSQKRVIFAIEDATDNKLVGFSYLEDINWIDQTCYVGIMIGNKERHGKGLGNSALAQTLEYGFNTLNLRKILSKVLLNHSIAKSMNARFNLKEEGRLRNQVYLNGQYHDLLILGLERGDYKGRNV